MPRRGQLKHQRLGRCLHLGDHSLGIKNKDSGKYFYGKKQAGIFLLESTVNFLEGVVTLPNSDMHVNVCRSYNSWSR